VHAENARSHRATACAARSILHLSSRSAKSERNFILLSLIARIANVEGRREKDKSSRRLGNDECHYFMREGLYRNRN